MVKVRRSFLRDSLDILICTAGIYACYITYGVLQEKIYTTPYGAENDKFDSIWTLVFVQSCLTAFIGWLWTKSQDQPKHVVPPKDYIMIACTHVGAMVCSNTALGYLSYPTQVLGKSCKVVPVLLMRIFRGFHWTVSDFIVVGSITTGISLFLLSKSSDKASASAETAATDDSEMWMSLKGYALLIMSLALDSFTAPHEEVVKKRYHPSVAQMMLHLNLWSAIVMAAVVLLSGEWQSALDFCSKHPAIVSHIILLSVASAVGQIFILYCVFTFNSLVQTTITTTRKFFTILVSVLWFGHSVSAVQWFAIVLVFFGLGYNAYAKYRVRHSPPTPSRTEKDLKQP